MASRGVVAGFEEQEAANELSARLVAEALEAVGAKQQQPQQQGDEGASMPPSAQVPEIRASGAMAQTASVENSGEAEVAGAASSPAVAQGEIERLEREDARDSSGPEAEASGDELSSDNRSTPGGRRRDSSLASNYDDFCGQQASELNLRQLKMEALDDVLVCGRSRHATESARRLFSLLASSNGAQATTPAKLNASDSLSSRSSGHFDADDDDDEEEPDAHEELLALNGQPDDEVKQLDERGQSDAYDYGTIKLARRKRAGAASACSDVWSSDKNNNDNNDIDDNTTSYGRTLVCSVSPVSSSSSRNSNAQLETLEGKGELLVLSERQFDTACYPIDGDEMRQCRAAFRENRRLIEQAQARALSRMQEAAGDGHGDAGDDEARLLTGSGALSRSSSRATERSHWADSLGRRARPIKCSHCAREIYPVERMELDFTRAKLNIHRNCFKCQVCSTLLRLETYASIDTKLYCPAHTRRAAPVAPRAAS